MFGLREFVVPLVRPLSTAGGSIEARTGFLVHVDDDTPGVGEATPLHGWTEPLAACRSALEAAVEAFERGRTDALSTVAETPAARHGLAVALADQEACRAGRPLYRHLGGTRRVDSVPVNATLGDASIEATIEAASRAADDGFDSLKLKVGAKPVAEDLDRVGAVREAVGPKIDLRVDANAGWSPQQARQALRGLAEADVSFVEQPLATDDLDGHAALRGGSVGIALDESLTSHSVEAILAAGAADVVVLKPMALGGVDRAREAAVAARAAGVEPVVTTTVDAVVARTAAVHLAASLAPLPACGLATADWLDGDVAPDPAPVNAGEVKVPQADGHGVHVEWDAI